MQCPKCGRTDSVADYLAKLAVVCKSCGTRMEAGAPTAVAPVAPAPTVLPPPPPAVEKPKLEMSSTIDDPSSPPLRMVVREQEPESQPIPSWAAPLADLPEPPKPKPPMAPRASGLASLVATLGKEAEAKPPKATLAPPEPRPELPEFEPAPRWRRLAARLIDLAIVIALAFTVAILLPRSISRDTGLSYWIVLTPVAIYCIINVVLLSTRGQHFGKIVMGIRIVDEVGHPVGFLRGFLLRDGANWLMRFGARVIAFALNDSGFFPETIQWAIPYADQSIDLIDCLFIFSADQRCIHDRIAGTRVVRVPKES